MCTQTAADDAWPARVIDDEERDLTLASTSVDPLKPTEWLVLSNLYLVVNKRHMGCGRGRLPEVRK